jgi:hypothetical protein
MEKTLMLGIKAGLAKRDKSDAKSDNGSSTNN